MKFIYKPFAIVVGLLAVAAATLGPLLGIVAVRRSRAAATPR